MMTAMEAEPKPFVAPCRDLPPGAPFGWLKAGWGDFRAAPGLSLAWGLFCWMLSTAITLLAWKAGGWVLLVSATAEGVAQGLHLEGPDGAELRIGDLPYAAGGA